MKLIPGHELNTTFEQYFTLEEAVLMLRYVKQVFEQAQEDLKPLRDDIVLYKRIHMMQDNEGIEVRSAQTQRVIEVLQQKWEKYEDRFDYWAQKLIDKGIIVRDMQKGLIDFPYRSKEGEEFLLCWHLGEDGIFYFHSADEGFAGRKPISLLPE